MITLIAVVLMFGVVYYAQRLIKLGYKSLKTDLKDALDMLNDKAKNEKDDNVIEIQKEDVNKM